MGAQERHGHEAWSELVYLITRGYVEEAAQKARAMADSPEPPTPGRCPTEDCPGLVFDAVCVDCGGFEVAIPWARIERAGDVGAASVTRDERERWMEALAEAVVVGNLTVSETSSVLAWVNGYMAGLPVLDDRYFIQAEARKRKVFAPKAP